MKNSVKTDCWKRPLALKKHFSSQGMTKVHPMGKQNLHSLFKKSSSVFTFGKISLEYRRQKPVFWGFFSIFSYIRFLSLAFTNEIHFRKPSFGLQKIFSENKDVWPWVTDSAWILQCISNGYFSKIHFAFNKSGSELYSS